MNNEQLSSWSWELIMDVIEQIVLIENPYLFSIGVTKFVSRE